MDKEARKKGGEGSAIKGWVLVFGLAVGFLLYGLFMYVAVGDKGPPDWDFNVVEDTPGKSVYSTSPEPAGNTGAPVPQHVSGKPDRATADGKGKGK